MDKLLKSRSRKRKLGTLSTISIRKTSARKTKAWKGTSIHND